MEIASDLVQKLDDYLRGRCSLWDLESWLAPRLRQYIANPNSMEGRLAGAIELCLAEMSDGIRTERSTKKALASFLKELTAQPKEVVFTP